MVYLDWPGCRMGGGPIDEGQRSGFGVVGDIIVGVIGALLGGFLFRTLA